MIRTLLVHDVPLTNTLLTTVLDAQEDICVVDCATTPAEALAKLTSSPCDVMVVSGSLSNEGALTLTRATVKQYSNVKVVLTDLVESQTPILHHLEAGAAGYVCTTEGVQQLLAVIRHAVEGQALLSPAVAAALIARVTELKRLATEVNGYHEMDMEQQASKLTKSERKVLALLSAGYTDRQIAEKRAITVGTVKNHVHNILGKLDVHTRWQAAMVAHQLTLGPPKAKRRTKRAREDRCGRTMAARPSPDVGLK